MKTYFHEVLIVYGSVSGNTEKIARAIGKGIDSKMDAEMLRVIARGSVSRVYVLFFK